MASSDDLEDMIIDLKNEIELLREEVKKALELCAAAKTRKKRKPTAYSMCVGDYMKKHASGVKDNERRKKLFKEAALSCKRRP